MIVGKPQLLKNLNSDIVRDFIYREGPVSKPEIAVGTALTLPTVKKRWTCCSGKAGSEKPAGAERAWGAKRSNMKRTGPTI